MKLVKVRLWEGWFHGIIVDEDSVELFKDPRLRSYAPFPNGRYPFTLSCFRDGDVVPLSEAEIEALLPKIAAELITE